MKCAAEAQVRGIWVACHAPVEVEITPDGQPPRPFCREHHIKIVAIFTSRGIAFTSRKLADNPERNN